MTQPEQQDKRFDYDIAVSFAGEDRQYVYDLVTELKANGVTVFYDEDALAELWGANLIDFLEKVYNRRARYALIFISKYYVEKKWTNHERQSAQARALQQASPYILPVRLDDSELPGLHGSVGYVDARRYGIAELSALVLTKLRGPDGSVTESSGRATSFSGRVPRSAQEIEILLENRPPSWEYLLYGALLLDGNRKLDGKYQDHVIRYARRSGNRVRGDEVAAEARLKINEVEGIIDFFNRKHSPWLIFMVCSCWPSVLACR